MKRIVTPTEMQEIDRRTIQDHKIPGELLMERAGQEVFRHLRESLSNLKDKVIYVFCGRGNNGGDGFVVARCLREHGAQPEVFVTGNLQDIKMDARIHFNKMIAAGIDPVFVSRQTEFDKDAPDVIVDALLGTGSRGALEDDMLMLVCKINEWRQSHGSYIVAIDIPSGLNGETGEYENAAVCANSTVTMGLPKTGLLFGKGRQYAGQLHIADLGFPKLLTEGGSCTLVERADIKRLLKPRRHDAYKYEFGKVLVVAGSRGMSGAAWLTGKSALRIGAGLVKVAMPAGVAHVLENSLPEAMTLHMEETPEGTLAYKNFERLSEYIQWADVVALGPGLSQNHETIELVKSLCKNLNRPAVIDADAIIALAGEFEMIAAATSDLVLTPHLGEFAAFSQVLKDKILTDRVSQVRSMSKKIKKCILFKGSPTLISGSSGHVYVCNKGNPGMATAGSGDVLTGAIVGLMAQGLAVEEAAYAGAYIHGMAGDMVSLSKTEMGLIASDIIEHIPEALKQIMNLHYPA